MLKRISHIILLFTMCLIPFVSMSNHILGGDIFYEHISNKKYKVLVRIYRDCKECTFNGNGGGSLDTCADLQEIILYNKNDGTFLEKISLTRESFKDITPVCASVTSRCSGNQGSPYGIEEHWFSCEVDFSNYSNVCNFEISTKMSSRSTEIHENNQAQHYYNNSVIDLCKASNNNSVRFESKPLQIVYLNEPVRYNIEAIDTDGDSLSFALVKAKISFDKFIAYPTDRSETKPLDVKCSDVPCTVNKDLAVPTGIYFNESSGELVFTPNKLNESGVFVIEITEFRNVNGNMEIVGVTRSDVQFYVANSPGNIPPKLLNDNLTFSICAGDEICIDFNAVAHKTGLVYDTVNFSCFSSVDNFFFKVNPSNNPPYNSLSYCWKTSSFDARSEPYYFTLKLEDNGCPIRKTTYATFTVLVKEGVSAIPSIKNSGCGKLDLSAITKTGSNFSSYWQIQNSSLDDLKFFYEKDTFWQADSNSTYHIWYVNQNDDNGCNIGFLDTVVIDNISDITVDIGNDLEYCEGANYAIVPDVQGAMGSISYLWNNSVTHSSYTSTVYSTKKVKLIVTDENSCSAQDSITVSPFGKLNVSIPNQMVCFTEEYLDLNNLFLERGNVQDYTFYSNGIDNAAVESNNGDWVLSLFKFVAPKTYEIFLDYTDLNGCHFTDTFEVKVTNKPETDFSDIRSICSNEKSVLLNRETNNLFDGTWSFNVNPSLLNVDKLDVSSLNSGVNYVVNFYTSIEGCEINEDFNFMIQEAPMVSIVNPNFDEICISSDLVTLTSNVGGGVWNGNGVLGNKFDPSASTKPISEISYYYTDTMTGCSNSDTLLMNISKKPVFAFESNFKEICEGGNTEIEFFTEHQNRVEITSQPNVLVPTISNKIKLDHLTFSGINKLVVIGVSKNDVCPESRDTFVLDIIEYPTGELSPSIKVGCEPLNFDFRLINSNYSLTDLDILLEGQNVLINSLKINRLEKGQYDYNLIADYKGCTDTISYKGIIVNPSPIAYFDVNPKLIFADDPIVNYTDLTISDDSYNSNWSFEGKIDSGYYKDDIIIKYASTLTTYTTTLKTVTPSGCEDEHSEVIEILPSRELYIPTAFTPNGKGPSNNEKFTVVSTVSGDYNMVILNRWGEEVFRSNDIQNSWDGTYNNKPCKPGAYTYQIKVNRIDGFNKEYSGVVVLLRAGE